VLLVRPPSSSPLLSMRTATVAATKNVESGALRRSDPRPSDCETRASTNLYNRK
jgi:hypothetical protein